MELKFVDPRSLKDNPDKARRSKSSPQADALLLATIKAIGVVEPLIVFAEADGGNGFVIDQGHRRAKQAIAAGIEEVAVLVVPRAEDGGAMRSLATSITHEQLNPVDLWRAIERLVALNWTEESVAIALAQSVRQIKKLRLLANVLPAMLEAMAKGDMPNEQQLRTIAAASLEEQKEVWKAKRPSKDDPQVSWWSIANGLTKRRMYARDASFGDELREAYGIAWVEDLFAPADQDSRYTTDVEAFLGAQQEWMTQNLPKKGVITEPNAYGEVKLPPKAERVYGTPKKSDRTAMYLDREGKVKTVQFRLTEAKKKANSTEAAEAVVIPKSRPDMTRKGIEMIGDLRTDALHEALSRAPITDHTLLALLVLAFAGQNVRVDSGAGGNHGFGRCMPRHAATLFDAEGKFAFDAETLRIAARGVLIDALSCREGMSKSGVVALVAGGAIGADSFLANMGTEDFLSCLSRPALEGSCADTPVLPRARVRDTRAALVEHFKERPFVHPAALFTPDAASLTEWLSKSTVAEVDDDLGPEVESLSGQDQRPEKGGLDDGYREAAE
ncbi:plasmid partitioning protein [Mesorhizobium sp. LCM 4577]|uniref:ParB family protein n=1 Tax=Mesorhizobium plurifarium TaxID=69974 RepID=A0A090G3U3_MESPL|nr:ParB N-terminal domain-containing protein [Mesorhizobium sp. LCM 4577]OHV68939.1 plasmid partitioning protein [Mesorhizobium sp. LCM 4577]CDX51816.1 ParB family protein [Mesorhizobium plurifarium]